MCTRGGLVKIITVMNGYLFAQIVAILTAILSTIGIITAPTASRRWTKVRIKMKYFKDSTFILEALVLMATILTVYWIFRIAAILLVKGII